MVISLTFGCEDCQNNSIEMVLCPAGTFSHPAIGVVCIYFSALCRTNRGGTMAAFARILRKNSLSWFLVFFLMATSCAYARANDDRTLELTVAGGSNLSRIAEEYLGDSRKWRAIARGESSERPGFCPRRAGAGDPRQNNERSSFQRKGDFHPGRGRGP